MGNRPGVVIRKLWALRAKEQKRNWDHTVVLTGLCWWIYDCAIFHRTAHHEEGLIMSK